MVEWSPTIQVLPSAADAVEPVLAELRRAIADRPNCLVSFATGASHAAVLQRLAVDLAQQRPSVREFLATHLDEYIGYGPDRRGGMVHELRTRCPPFEAMLRRGTFVPVPCDGEAEPLRRHEQRLLAAGGVALQLLGIGRNGHLAFNEPGTPFDLGFHVAELAATTRDDARRRFAPEQPPRRAATAGIASILAARRLVLCAFGRAKAEAVRAMLEGPIAPSCPASALRLHGNVLVLLDAEAAALCSSVGAV